MLASQPWASDAICACAEFPEPTCTAIDCLADIASGPSCNIAAGERLWAHEQTRNISPPAQPTANPAQPPGAAILMRARGAAAQTLKAVAMLALCGLSLRAARAEPLTVFAAASLKTALDDVAAAFTQTTDHSVAISYAGTSVLARQISLGAPADVVISASTEWMDWLQARGAIDASSRVDLARNRLVLIAHGPDAPSLSLTPEALGAHLGTARMAMALVDAVPAGIYGKAALTHFDLWEQVAPQVAQTDNVRAALALVATGAVPFGIVYATDARAEPRIKVLATFPAHSHPEIRYPAALVSGPASEAAEAFLRYLQTADARSVLSAHGFVVTGDAP